MNTTSSWWQSAVIYQIFLRSFQDSNGDGVGDLKGIEGRLDYLARLGVDGLWISSFYPSPMVDFGADVSDFSGVDPRFGSLEDFKDLLKAAQKLKLKVLLDFVPQYTSEKHLWFIESRYSRTNPKRDWYIWRDESGGPEWSLDEGSNQFYSHGSLKELPELNWMNPEVRGAIYQAMRFWLDLGVDGFRISVVKDKPEMHQILREMRTLVDEYADRVLIGDLSLPYEKLMTYYGSDLDEVHFPLNFELITAKWDATVLSSLMKEYESYLPEGAWPNWMLGTSERSRIATRIGSSQARLAAMLILTLRGTPALYYGDEVGLENVRIPSHLIQDPREIREPGQNLGRDPERSPMPWDTSEFAGFSLVTPWLPLNEDYLLKNVESEFAQTDSLLVLYQALLYVRKKYEALRLGDVTVLPVVGSVLWFTRTTEEEAFLIALNLGTESQNLIFPHWVVNPEIIMSTFSDFPYLEPQTLKLRGAEGAILRYRSPQKNLQSY